MNVSDIIAQVESARRDSALRFEPAKWSGYLVASPHLPELAAAAHYNECSLDTARMVCASSWGRYQLMGFNLYAPTPGGFGYAKPIADFIASPVDQCSAFLWFIHAHRLDDITADQLENDAAARIRFATAYNGPGQPEVYAQMIVNAIKALNA
jgi:hypothetical protein